MEISKIIAGTGLIFDIVGVLLLISTEIFNRKSEILQEQSFENKNFVDVLNAALIDKKLPSNSEEILLEKRSKKLPLKKAQQKSIYALIFIILGFFLQFIALFF